MGKMRPMSPDSAIAGSRSLSDAACRSPSTPSTGRVDWRSLATNLLVACLLTMSAGLIAVRISANYYSVAPYHHDSATYRWYAYRSYELLKAEGLAQASTAALKSMDSLDVLLRVLLLPRSLLHAYGHLVVLLPFMWLFVWLTVHYVYMRTRSRTSSIAIPAFLFALPIVYDPLIVGIADYWKDNLAVWLLAGAVMSFLLSQGLQRLSFSCLSGALLGLLAMQRTVLAVYATPLFLPLIVIATVRRLRAHGRKDTALRLGAFAAFPVAIAGWLVLAQSRQLYSHYFVVGYGYSSMLGVARFLFAVLRTQLGFTPLVLLSMGLLLLWRVLRAHERDGGAIAGAWMALAFPLVVIASRAHYPGFGVTWLVLLVVMLATTFSAFLRSARPRGPYVISLVVLVSACSLLQYRASIAKAAAVAQQTAPKRRFHAALAETLLGLPAPRRVALLYDEDAVPFLNYVLFNRHVPLDAADGVAVTGFMSIHDTYYRAVFGDVSQQKIQDSVKASLEAQPGTLAVGMCEPATLRTAPIFSADGTHVAAPVAVEINKHLLASPQWSVLRRLDSPYGCTYVYQYHPEATTSTEKWKTQASPMAR